MSGAPRNGVVLALAVLCLVVASVAAVAGVATAEASQELGVADRFAAGVEAAETASATDSAPQSAGPSGLEQVLSAGLAVLAVCSVGVVAWSRRRTGR